MKMVLTLQSNVDVEKVVETVMDMVRGRYSDTDYYREIVVPQATPLGYNGRIKKGWKASYASYTIDADSLDPAIISAIESLTRIMDMAYSWRKNDKPYYDRYWWKPQTMYFEEVSINGKVNYDSGAAREAREWYDEMIKD